MEALEKTLIEQARDIKKAAGKEAALEFLFTSKVNVNSDLAGYLDRIKIYATGSKKYSQDAILNVFDQVIAKMQPQDVWRGYSQKAEMLRRYGLLEDAKNICDQMIAKMPRQEVWNGYSQRAEILERLGLKEEASRNYAGAMSNLSPYDSAYLFNLYMLQRKFAWLCSSNGDYVFWSIVSDLISTAWVLCVEMKGKIDQWLIRSDVFPVTKPSFKDYLHTSKAYDGFYEEALQEINPLIPVAIYEEKINKMFTIDYPARLGFKQEYFKSNYNDADFYNEIMGIYGKDFDKIFPSKAMCEASEVVNEFLKEINPVKI